jgi:phosphatidylglycerophosphatase A
MGLPLKLFVTFFGLGLSPKAPGTVGSLGSALVAWPLLLLAERLGVPFLLLGLAQFLFLMALPFVWLAMEGTGTDDPGWIVIDETCGQWLALSLVPPGWILAHPWSLLVGFGLFRFFDILKPLGIKRLEALPGAFGVMADDVLGGLYAGLCLHLGFQIFFQFID